MDLTQYLPMDVPKEKEKRFLKHFKKATGGSGRLMLFAGDQKVEHLNNDFFGEEIPPEDNDPEHLFKIASKANIGVFATQFGLISRYARNYPEIPYLMKLNAKTNLIPYTDKDPYSKQWLSVADVVAFQKQSGLKILGVGYTVYLGSEHEREMLAEAAQIVHQAHQQGLIAVLWMYPKGKYVKDEYDGHLIAGAAGVAACLGADFAKVKVPYKEGKMDLEGLKEVVTAAGRTGILCEGGSKVDAQAFLTELYAQIYEVGCRGNGTGRNIHQRTLKEAVKMANAIYKVTVKGQKPKKVLSS